MAAATSSSPAIINTPSETTATPSPGAGTPTPVSNFKSPSFPPMTTTPNSSRGRGLNKPRCCKCGNVARSRCPFVCCKSCCFTAQNPCHIHVLKPNTTLADRGASGNSTIPEQQPSEVAPPVPSAKVTSVRQLSKTFSQFNNVHISLRSRKPLTRKDALVINEWRFARLKEYKDNRIEAENEAFNRYMQNINLLEEVFDVDSERPNEHISQMSNLPLSAGEKMEMVTEMKAQLRSDPVRVAALRKRVLHTVDDGLRNFQGFASNDNPGDLDDEDEIIPKAAKNWWGGKTSALTELNDKLNYARNEEDLKLCMQLEGAKEQTALNDLAAAQKSGNFLLKYVRSTEIDQDALASMDSHFSSLDEIEDL